MSNQPIQPGGNDPAATEDPALIEEWAGRLDAALAAARACGPLEAMRKLADLLQAARNAGLDNTRALELATVRRLAAPPRDLNLLLVRFAPTAPFPAAEGPLLAHIYAEGFWPVFIPAPRPSQFTDLQRAAITTALAQLRSEKAWPAVLQYFEQQLLPACATPPVPFLKRIFGANPATPAAKIEPLPLQAGPVTPPTNREVLAHLRALGGLIPHDQITPLCKRLEPLQLSGPGTGKPGRTGADPTSPADYEFTERQTTCAGRPLHHPAIAAVLSGWLRTHHPQIDPTDLAALWKAIAPLAPNTTMAAACADLIPDP